MTSFTSFTGGTGRTSRAPFSVKWRSACLSSTLAAQALNVARSNCWAATRQPAAGQQLRRKAFCPGGVAENLFQAYEDFMNWTQEHGHCA